MTRDWPSAPIACSKGQNGLTAPRSPNVLAYMNPFRYLALWQRGSMVQRVSTVAFEGIEARGVDVQVQVAPGLPAFTIVCRQ